jgi:hypothetical protein
MGTATGSQQRMGILDLGASVQHPVSAHLATIAPRCEGDISSRSRLSLVTSSHTIPWGCTSASTAQQRRKEEQWEQYGYGITDLRRLAADSGAAGCCRHVPPGRNMQTAATPVHGRRHLVVSQSSAIFLSDPHPCRSLCGVVAALPRFVNLSHERLVVQLCHTCIAGGATVRSCWAPRRRRCTQWLRRAASGAPLRTWAAAQAAAMIAAAAQNAATAPPAWTQQRRRPLATGRACTVQAYTWTLPTSWRAPLSALPPACLRCAAGLI